MGRRNWLRYVKRRGVGAYYRDRTGSYKRMRGRPSRPSVPGRVRAPRRVQEDPYQEWLDMANDEETDKP